MKKVYFISDIHFGMESKERESLKETQLVSLLDSIRKDASHLIILGDLFDYWFEYKRVIQKGYYRLFGKLSELSKSGVKIIYLIGNHDFMHRDFFRNEFNAELIEDEKTLELLGKKLYLAHGDGFNKKDIGYNILKKFMRNKFMQKLFSLLHPDFGIKLASKSSKKSREYTSNKFNGENDALIGFAKRKIDEGFDFVVLGHTHIKTKLKYKTGFYINLGTWLDKPYYGVFDGITFEIIEWKKEFNGSKEEKK